MSPHDNPTPDSPSLMSAWFRLLAAYRPVVRQERVFVRLVTLSVASLLGLGRHTISQLLVALGVAHLDWSAWHRLFSRGRIDVAALQTTLLAQVVEALPADGPIPVVVDATQLPRSSRRFPGSGLTISPRSPKWQRGLHLAQRFVLLSLLLPRSAQGFSRALPLTSRLLRSAKTTTLGSEPERTEGQGALELVHWARAGLDALGRTAQWLLVLGDGAYSSARMLAGLPERTILVARCAKNRALFATPSAHAGRGRPRWYGAHGPTPTETLHEQDGWQAVSFWVRGREVTVTAKLTGPWLVKGAPGQPVALLVVRGVDRGAGVTRRQREPQFFLVTVEVTGEGAWTLPLPLAELLAWTWQRWEVEVMHRELKSGLGLGEQQAFSHRGAATVIPWLVWVYALLVLAAYQTWGYAPPPGPDRGRWWRPRRWSIGRLLQQARQELWQLGDFQPGWQRSPDTWAEIAAWTSTHLPTVLGCRRL